MKVLFSNIGFKDQMLFVPIQWGKVRQFCEFVDERDFSFVEWLDPIFDGNVKEKEADEIIKRYDWKDIDIFFVSHYVWNWRINLYIIDRVREINPNIIVFGGGPSALYKPYQDTHLFYNHDYVSAGEAENICANVIWNVKHNLPLSEIEDIIDPREPKEIKPKRLELKTHKSPYLSYKNDFIRFSEKIVSEGKQVGVMFETNRGCPYKCSFCDWGLTTNSKIKRYDVEMVKEEISFICGNLQPYFIFWADANVGIFEEDIEYAKLWGLEKQKNGWPKSIYYAPAKNNKKNTNRIVETLYDYGAVAMNQLSFQHFDEEVLAAIDRSDIPLSQLREAMDSSFKKKIPLEAALICGNPGDTLKKWKDALNEALECNFAELRVHDFMMLPNAPAAHPDYIEKYKIKLNKSYHFEYESSSYQENMSYFEAYYTKASYSFTEDDYAEMQLYTAILFSLNSFGVTRLIEKWAYHNSNISFMDFYDLLREKPFFAKITNELLEGIKKWVNEERSTKHVDFQDVEVTYDYFIYLQCVYNHEIFYNEVRQVLLENYTDDEKLVDNLITYQKRTLRCHWPQDTITVDYDFPTYIGDILRLNPNNRIPDFEIEKKPTVLETKETNVPKDFNDLKYNWLFTSASGKGQYFLYKNLVK